MSSICECLQYCVGITEETFFKLNSYYTCCMHIYTYNIICGILYIKTYCAYINILCKTKDKLYGKTFRLNLFSS